MLKTSFLKADTKKVRELKVCLYLKTVVVWVCSEKDQSDQTATIQFRRQCAHKLFSVLKSKNQCFTLRNHLDVTTRKPIYEQF